MPASLKHLSAALMFCLSAAATHAADAAGAGAGPVFSYSVICDEPAVAARLRMGIESRFARMHVAMRESFPNAKLFVYANRDRNDQRNTDGMSVAIAHVSNIGAAVIASDFIQRKQTLPEALQAMLGQEGVLLHLNVAHMTTPSDSEVNLLLDQVVGSFVQKYAGADGVASALPAAATGDAGSAAATGAGPASAPAARP